MNDAHPDFERQFQPRAAAPRTFTPQPWALLAFVVVGNLAAIGAWHVLRWLTLAAVAFAQSHGL